MGALVDRDSPIGDIPRDSTVVVAGPPMTGKYMVMLSIIAHLADDAIVISTKNGSGRVLEDLDRAADDGFQGRVGIQGTVQSSPDQFGQQSTVMFQIFPSLIDPTLLQGDLNRAKQIIKGRAFEPEVDASLHR
jgi:hypothetical protein